MSELSFSTDSSDSFFSQSPQHEDVEGGVNNKGGKVIKFGWVEGVFVSELILNRTNDFIKVYLP